MITTICVLSTVLVWTTRFCTCRQICRSTRRVMYWIFYTSFIKERDHPKVDITLYSNTRTQEITVGSTHVDDIKLGGEKSSRILSCWVLASNPNLIIVALVHVQQLTTFASAFARVFEAWRKRCCFGCRPAGVCVVLLHTLCRNAECHGDVGLSSAGT